jgi:Prealbumin-like fold domain
VKLKKHGSGGMKRLALLMIACIFLLGGVSCSNKPGQISGVVAWMTKGAGAVVLPGVAVNVWEQDAKDPSKYTKIGSGTTDNNGHYTIMNIPPGTYFLTAYQAPAQYPYNNPEKAWYIGPIIMQSGGTGLIDLNFQNALTSSLPENLKY